MYANFNKFDNKCRRLAIFAEPYNETLTDSISHLFITVITCSKSDQFSKKKAWELFKHHNDLLKGEVANDFKRPVNPYFNMLKIVDNKPKRTFINWCNENYYYKGDYPVIYDRVVLVKGDEQIILKDRKSKDTLENNLW